MRHFPIFLDLRGRIVVVSGAGEIAVAKLRLLLKSEARIVVFGTAPDDAVKGWAAEGRITFVERAVVAGDAIGAALFYGANGDAVEDARAAAIGRSAGALVNIVDNLEASAFITPAIVDRDPVTVAIGTEGAAPVLARKIKAEVEAMLPVGLGVLARIGQAFRGRVEALDSGARRAFWTKFYFQIGPRALDAGEDAARDELERLLAAGEAAPVGYVHFIGSGPGDPELLTLKARRLLHEADVVIHDRSVPTAVLELARREASIVDVGPSPGHVGARIVGHARAGATVVRLRGGAPVLEEMAAVEAAGIGSGVVPGVAAACATEPAPRGAADLQEAL